VAAVPFHAWAPDAYEGAPTSVTAFMSVGTKAAGFAALGRVFLDGFADARLEWSAMLVPLAILSMVVGNLVAISNRTSRDARLLLDCSRRLRLAGSDCRNTRRLVLDDELSAYLCS